jgi:hypothetical protein
MTKMFWDTLDRLDGRRQRLSALLRGLKCYARLGAGAVEIIAVVTVTDTPLPFRVSCTSSGSL